MASVFPATDDHQHDSAHDTKPAEYWWERHALVLAVLQLEWTKLRVFFLCRPVDPAKGKANDADNDKNDADNSGRLHRVDVIMPGARKSAG